jgi:hypothetical protein
MENHEESRGISNWLVSAADLLGLCCTKKAMVTAAFWKPQQSQRDNCVEGICVNCRVCSEERSKMGGARGMQMSHKSRVWFEVSKKLVKVKTVVAEANCRAKEGSSG